MREWICGARVDCAVWGRGWEWMLVFVLGCWGVVVGVVMWCLCWLRCDVCSCVGCGCCSSGYCVGGANVVVLVVVVAVPVCGERGGSSCSGDYLLFQGLGRLVLVLVSHVVVVLVRCSAGRCSSRLCRCVIGPGGERGSSPGRASRRTIKQPQSHPVCVHRIRWI